MEMREQRTHSTAEIEYPPGPLKREVVDQPPGHAYEDRGPKVTISLGLGGVVAGDTQTGSSSSVGWPGRIHAGKRTRNVGCDLGTRRR